MLRVQSMIQLVAVMLIVSPSWAAGEINLSLRYQTETSPGSGRYHQLVRTASWNPEETAVIVCDVWDLHHSLNAVRRVEEFAPRLNELLKRLRGRGMTIIHSPSDCMAAYTDHPARHRAINAPEVVPLPDDIRSWCSRIPAEEKSVYPLDQSDGGDDDDPADHAEWSAKLKRLGRNPGTPWKTQSDLIVIDAARDFISDRGDEIWNVLESSGIKNVILTGVHTNMCVLGRPFGLRQMARNGKNVVLVRDLTDTMYNPARWPYVSHFSGTDLIVSHIEKFVCPTITSDQILGGKPFRFKSDTRPHVAIIMAEDEYETNQTLPRFAMLLGKVFRVTLVFGSEKKRNEVPGLDALDRADVALISVRRRTLHPEQLAIVRRFVESGKPIVGIRTASHAFSLRNAPAPEGFEDWPEFDRSVFGGNYTNHYGNKLASTVNVASGRERHPILAGIANSSFPQGGSLYMTSPLAPETSVLLTGSVEGKPAEPVAWTFRRKDGGRSFYTSMGNPKDFDNPEFIRLLSNAIGWAADVAPAANVEVSLDRRRLNKDWSLTEVPSSAGPDVDDEPGGKDGPTWYRCAVRLREDWLDPNGVFVDSVDGGSDLQLWFNGHALRKRQHASGLHRYLIQQEWIEANDANLFVARLNRGVEGWTKPPRIVSGERQLELRGRWQFRAGDNAAWSNIPLPARYGISTDILFEP